MVKFPHKKLCDYYGKRPDGTIGFWTIEENRAWNLCVDAFMKALNENGHKHWIDGTITGECNCNARHTENECELCHSKEHHTLHCEMAPVYRTPKNTENENKLVKLDENKFFNLLMPYHGGNIDTWASTLQKLWERHFSKFGVPMQVPSIELLVDALMTVQLEGVIDENSGIYPDEDGYIRLATAIHNLLTGEKK